MRVNARFDTEAEQQVTYLAEATGMGVSEVLRTSVQHYYDTVRAQRGGLKHLTAFIGQGAAYADFQMNHGRAAPLPPVIMSSVKIRQAGFHACMDTEDMFRKWFGQLQERRLLPSAAQARAAG